MDRTNVNATKQERGNARLHKYAIAGPTALEDALLDDEEGQSQ